MPGPCTAPGLPWEPLCSAGAFRGQGWAEAGALDSSPTPGSPSGAPPAPYPVLLELGLQGTLSKLELSGGLGLAQLQRTQGTISGPRKWVPGHCWARQVEEGSPWEPY